MEGPLGCPQPGLLSCPGTNAIFSHPGSCLVPCSWVSMPAPAGWGRWFCAVCGQRKGTVRDSRPGGLTFRLSYRAAALAHLGQALSFQRPANQRPSTISIPKMRTLHPQTKGLHLSRQTVSHFRQVSVLFSTVSLGTRATLDKKPDTQETLPG